MYVVCSPATGEEGEVDTAEERRRQVIKERLKEKEVMVIVVGIENDAIQTCTWMLVCIELLED